MKIIAYAKNAYKEKFGIPRQSGLVDEVETKIIFTQEYAFPEAVKGLEEYSHIWILWQFSENRNDTFSPTVRPPRLGGNKRVGVFATRSPYRPNGIGLSSVKLNGISFTKSGAPVLSVTGADLMDGTPVIDIKPYISYTDAHPDAVCGFADKVKGKKLTVTAVREVENQLNGAERSAVIKILEGDPRPAYKDDEGRVYAFNFNDREIKFKVTRAQATIISAEKRKENK